MNINDVTYAVSLGTTPVNSDIDEMFKKANEDQEKFEQIWKQVEAAIGTDAERRQKRVEQAKEAQEAHEKNKKIQELLTKIAQLRAKLCSVGGVHDGIQSEIDALQNELFWLMYGL